MTYFYIMLTIRLQRTGKKKFPTYKLVISEKARDTQDKYLELLGTYNPHAKENQFLPRSERIQYWFKQGAQTSTTVHNLLVKAGVTTGAKKKAVYLSKKRKTKVAEKKATGEKATADKKAAALVAEALAKEAEKAAALAAEALAKEEAEAAKPAEAQTEPVDAPAPVTPPPTPKIAPVA